MFMERQESNVQSQSLLVSGKLSCHEKSKYLSQRLCCYLQIDENSFHVLGSQYKLQWVHVVLQEASGKGIEIGERTSVVLFSV